MGLGLYGAGGTIGLAVGPVLAIVLLDRLGPVDQAALHGILQKLRDVAIPLISLTPFPPEAPTNEGHAPRHEGN